jgi:predicted phosphodiesterase
MTRVAILADIHGNVPALEAVLADVRRQCVDEVLVGGDLVGRGPQGSEVVRRIAATGWASVRGNHEDYLLDFRRGNVPKEWLHAEAWSAWRWMAAELTEPAVEYIERLPESVSTRAAPGVRLFHGSTRSPNDGLGPWSSDRELEGHLESIGEQVLACAHTHRPMARRIGERLVLNVGSVGLPFNGDRRAQYAILTRVAAGWEAELRRVEYDLRRTVEAYESTGFLDAGGVSAELLRLELQHATPFLVPFLRWASALEVEPTLSDIPAFLECYDPDHSTTLFLRRLKAKQVSRLRVRNAELPDE